MQFSKSFPDEIKSQITASDVVGKLVALDSKGKGLCPFHPEKTPSFSVNDQKGFYYCFGCGAHGDIINFTMEKEGLAFKDAVVKLANDYSIQIPIIANEEKAEENDREFQKKIERDYLLLETICQFFENNLFSSSGFNALNYLYQRGLANSHIKKFRLGFALDNYEILLKHLKAKGFHDSELLNSGVIAKSSNGNLYDKFRSRVIFPITNSKGKIIAFGGRILGEGQPKYLNSSETELFKKGHNLYNFSFSRKAIYEQKYVVIVEGYMDAISLSINGIENVVAPLGTSLTLDQLRILFKNTDDIVVCLDGDIAGIKAMRRVIDLALPIINPKNLIRFAILPNKVDPDDFVRQNGLIITKKFLENAENLSKVLFDFEAQDLHLDFRSEALVSPEKKAQLEAKLFHKINLISDTNSKKYFLQYYKNLLFEIGKNKKFQNKIFTTKSVAYSNFELDKQDIYSLAIIAAIINFPVLKDYQDEFCVLKNLEFKNQELSDIKEHLINFIEQNNSANFIEIKANLEKIIFNDELKNKIFSTKFSSKNLEYVRHKLEIFVAQYFYEDVSNQYRQTMASTDDIETDEKVLKAGKHKELFDYKTILEKKILRLESDTM